MIHTADADFTLMLGDVMPELANLPDESVHCVVTSPPYWGLRDYGTGEWAGGDTDCDHLMSNRYSASTTLNAKVDDPASEAKRTPFREVCGKCGAQRVDQQLGLEPTPEQYVARMVEVFREVRRVLRADGTCWVNLGDSYAGGGGGNYAKESKSVKGRDGVHLTNVRNREDWLLGAGYKAKDLCGIPWRVAFALQADGWYLRSDIIWAKPNPMPESVTDRPTKSHEYVFLLTKSPRYFFDQEAVREPHSDKTWFKPETWPTKAANQNPDSLNRNGQGLSTLGTEAAQNPAGRNVRTVWDIATQPYPEAHFATYPEELVRRCILAGSSERGCCPVCGKPWEREVEREPNPGGISGVAGEPYSNLGRSTIEREGKFTGRAVFSSVTTLGWRPGCDHDAEPIPCTVLDPFLGSGTTAYVARKHGRRSIGIELNPAYADLAARRMAQQSLEFAL